MLVCAAKEEGSKDAATNGVFREIALWCLCAAFVFFFSFFGSVQYTHREACSFASLAPSYMLTKHSFFFCCSLLAVLGLLEWKMNIITHTIIALGSSLHFLSFLSSLLVHERACVCVYRSFNCGE